MSLRIHHVVRSSADDAGSVTPLVRGLIRRLESHGLACTLHDAHENPAELEIAAIQKTDVVHVHACGYATTLAAARLAKRWRKRLVLSPAGTLDPAATGRLPRRLRWRGRLLERGRLRRAAAVLAQNEVEGGALRRRLGQNVRVLPYGIDFEPNDNDAPQAPFAFPDPPGGRCILMLAPIEPQTGCAALLKAFAEVGPDANDWYVVIAGGDRGDYRGMLEAAVRRKGGEARIVVTQAADAATQRALLRRAEVLVAPSFEPAAATSILLAARDGIPILAGRPILPDALRDAVVACDPHRAGIREGLRRILTLSGHAREDLANRARCAVRDRLNWAILAEQYVTLYNSIA